MVSSVLQINLVGADTKAADDDEIAGFLENSGCELSL